MDAANFVSRSPLTEMTSCLVISVAAVRHYCQIRGINQSPVLRIQSVDIKRKERGGKKDRCQSYVYKKL